MRIFQLSVLLSCLILLSACLKETDDNDVLPVKKSLSVQQLSLYQFTEVDIAFLKRFSINALGTPPESASNQFANNEFAAKLGKKLFFDKSLSQNNQFSCASCHQPERYFTDGLKRSTAVGTTHRSSPTILGAAYSPWQYWDGRKDSLWSQALGPIEDINEMNTTRVEYARQLLKKYPQDYQNIFGELSLSFLDELPAVGSPLGDKNAQAQWQAMDKSLKHQVNRVFTNAGKVMMAYQRQLTLPMSRFDQFVELLAKVQTSNSDSNSKNISQLSDILTPAEVQGMRLFVGKANCASCHNGPLFTNYEFHNIGAPEIGMPSVELGRHQGVKELLTDEFTCLSVWSDATENDCAEMLFLKSSGPELVGALKTPTLRNIGATAPYMQFGQFDNLQQVLGHYNKPSPPIYNRDQHPNRPHFDILPLKLDEQELLALESFLRTLTSPMPKDDPWWGF
ncbi:MAG: cytochrome C peroxidase [Alteromonadaceae bacterium]|nr:cytochrome C peroxidase [Alteromonadaceae bacterium]